MGKSFRVRMDNAKKSPPAADLQQVASDVTADVASSDGNERDFENAISENSAVSETPQGAPVPQEDVRSEAGDSAPSGDSQERESPPETPRKPQELFGDVEVCLALRIRRRVLAAARRAEGSRGRDWDMIGLHAGMTRSWVTAKALELHVVPNFDLLTPIGEGDNVVSCMYVTPIADNYQRVIAEIVATGERRLAFVRDWRTMQPREIFDCRNDHGRLNACWELNKVAY